MMKKAVFLIFSAFFAFSGFSLSAELVRNSAEMDTRYQAEGATTAMIVIFPFDSRALFSEDLDYLTVSGALQRDLKKAFRDRTTLEPVEERVTVLDDSARLTTVRDGRILVHEVPDYNEKESGIQAETILSPVKNAGLHLTGTVDAFIQGRLFEESYIRVTLRLIDSTTKVVYWITTMEGCYSYVVNSIADSVRDRTFRGPTAEEEKTAGWVDPRTERVKTLAWGLQFGTFTPLGAFRKEVKDDATMAVDLYFTVPILRPVRNKISLGVVDKVRQRNEPRIALFNFVPLNLSFMYDLPFIRVPNWAVYPRIDAGLIMESFSFPGLTYQKDGRVDVSAFGGAGVGTEYVFSSRIFRKNSFFFYLPSTGIFADFMFHFLNYRNADSSAHLRSAFNFSAGVKIHL